MKLLKLGSDRTTRRIGGHGHVCVHRTRHRPTEQQVYLANEPAGLVASTCRGWRGALKKQADYAFARPQKKFWIRSMSERACMRPVASAASRLSCRLAAAVDA